MTKISKHDLDRAIQLRKDEIDKAAYNAAKDRYSIVEGNKISDLDRGRLVGETYVGKTDKDGFNRLNIASVDNLTEGTDNVVHGVYERGLNSAINVAHSRGSMGIVSGEELESAPKTYHILQKFKDRKHLGNYGTHTNVNTVSTISEKPDKATSLLDMKRSDTHKILENAPVYELRTPTFHVMTKSTAFNPSIIDRFGKMHINTNDWNIYKALFPTILTGAGIYKFGSFENN